MTSCAQCRAPIPSGARNCPRCGITLTGIDHETYPGTGVHMGEPAPDAIIGRWVLDQYVVRSKLGEGGMGGVYLADQPAIGRQAVIKVIHPWLSRDKIIAARFATEAKAAARLQNPHIVSIFNYGRMPDGTLFLAMEHLAGRTLADLLRTEGHLDSARAVGIATQCCEALAHAHLRGVVHRDLKPSNIMLVRRDRGPEFVKVLDFGVAKLDGAGDGTAAGSMLGTPQYMSPEQLTAKPVDGRSDIYSLGLVLYEMLTGRPPFVADNAIGYVHLHTSESPRPLSQARAGLRVAPALEACLMRALAKSPHQRPQTAELFADELWSALMATVDSSHIPTPRTKPPAPARALVVGAVAGGVALVGALSVGAFMLLRPHAIAPGVEARPADAHASEAAVVRSEPPPPAPTRAPAKPSSAKSIAELEAAFLTMSSTYGVEQRREMLLQLRNAAAGDPHADDVVRARLLEWTVAYGDAEEPIEILE